MPRLYNEEDGYFFDPEIDGQTAYQLHEDNCFLNLHRLEPLKDRFCVEDPYDPNEKWYQWWRYDYGEEFKQMEDIAIGIGAVMLRQTAIMEVNRLFDVSHHFTDNDWQEMEEAL